MKRSNVARSIALFHAALQAKVTALKGSRDRLLTELDESGAEVERLLQVGQKDRTDSWM